MIRGNGKEIVNMENGKKLMIGAGVALAGTATVAAASYVFTKKLVRLALDREQARLPEKSHKRLAGSRKQHQSSELWEACAQKLENDPSCQTVEICASHDGTRLVGHWYPCDEPQRVIVAMHGWRSSWLKDFALIADFWHEHHCSILFAEQRGQGASDGAYMGFGLLERFDCLDWVNWVAENGGDGLPVYLSGVSMGASTVLMTAGLTLPECVHGVIADCGFTSPHEIWRHVVERNLHVPYQGINALVANDMCKKRIRFGTKDYSCTEAMRRCQVPVLFVHGTEDKFVPIEMTYRNYMACVALKRLLVVPGAGHGKSYLLEKERYERAVEDFWKDFD